MDGFARSIRLDKKQHKLGFFKRNIMQGYGREDSTSKEIEGVFNQDKLKWSSV